LDVPGNCVAVATVVQRGGVFVNFVVQIAAFAVVVYNFVALVVEIMGRNEFVRAVIVIGLAVAVEVEVEVEVGVGSVVAVVAVAVVVVVDLVVLVVVLVASVAVVVIVVHCGLVVVKVFENFVVEMKTAKEVVFVENLAAVLAVEQ